MRRRELLTAGSVAVSAGVVGCSSLGGDTGRDGASATPDEPPSEWDVFVVAGQSNAVGQGEARESPTPPPKTAYEYARGFLEPLSDPVGLGRHRASTGSAWPAFAETYWSETGRRSVYVLTAVNGTPVHPRATGPNEGSWGGPAGLLYRALGDLRGAMENLRREGVEPRFRGVLWHQGEADANAMNDGILTDSEYLAAFEGMLDRYRGLVDDERAPFWVFKLGRPRRRDNEGFRSVREVQAAVARRDPATALAFEGCFGFAERGLMQDNVHYDQRGLNEMGRGGGETVAKALE